ncbi:MAG: crotonase/enoyl-CoA hydratase family protein [Acidimicrobiales bacterium]|nr:crotonase/enoyl-CoA hydratase family protein [Acidimicrobiales bacterium]
MSEPLEPEPSPGVRIVRIGRPQRRNAVDTETAERLYQEFSEFDRDPDAKVAVLTGDQSAFCAGADLSNLPRLRDSGPLGPTRLELSKPTIAAIDGWCVAGGVELAAWCDIRVAGETAKFGCLERRWGVPLIDGGTVRLPRIVGLGRAMDLILSGRGFDAVEAERIGFVQRLVPAGHALGAAVELANEIASYPWPAVVHDRLSAYESYGLSTADALANEDRHGREVIFDPAFSDGVAKFHADQLRRRNEGSR